MQRDSLYAKENRSSGISGREDKIDIVFLTLLMLLLGIGLLYDPRFQ